jgi:hypothetical protein
MVVRDVEVLRTEDVPVAGALIETREEASVRTLVVEDVFAERMSRIVSHKAGTIQRLYLRHVIAEQTSEPAVTVESGRVGRLVMHSITGTEPCGVIGNGGIDSQENV